MIIAITDLLEAEGRAFRRGALRTGAGLACVWVAALLLLAGIGFCLWALYQWLVIVVGSIIGALLIGGILFLLSGVLIWTVIRLSR